MVLRPHRRWHREPQGADPDPQDWSLITLPRSPASFTGWVLHVRRSLGTTDLREAKAKAIDAYQRWLRDPSSDWLSVAGITANHVSFKQCAEGWLATAPRGGAYHKAVVRKFLLPFFDAERAVSNIATVDASLIEDYKLWRRTFWLRSGTDSDPRRRAGIQIDPEHGERQFGEPDANTLNREYPTLRQILKHAERKGYIPRGHIPSIASESARANPRPAFLGGDFEILRAQSETWVQEATDSDTRYKRRLLADWIYVNRYTGLRLPHEADQLTWNDINLSAAMLYVAETTKTGRREVPLREEAQTRLKAMKERRKAYCTANGQTFAESERVFVLENGAAYGDLPNLFGKLIKRCEFPQRAGQLPYTPYSLRHTYATFTLAEGKDYAWLEEVMGTSNRMLREHYTQGTIEQTRRYLVENGLMPAQGGLVAAPTINHSAAKLELIDRDSLSPDDPLRRTYTLVELKTK